MAGNRTGSVWRVTLVLCAFAAGYMAGRSGAGTDQARAEVRETTPRAAFQSGSERSETVLREIAATLKRMDGRWERIEKVATEKKTL